MNARHVMLFHDAWSLFFSLFFSSEKWCTSDMCRVLLPNQKFEVFICVLAWIRLSDLIFLFVPSPSEPWKRSGSRKRCTAFWVTSLEIHTILFAFKVVIVNWMNVRENASYTKWMECIVLQWVLGLWLLGREKDVFRSGCKLNGTKRGAKREGGLKIEFGAFGPVVWERSSSHQSHIVHTRKNEEHMLLHWGQPKEVWPTHPIISQGLNSTMTTRKQTTKSTRRSEI